MLALLAGATTASALPCCNNYGYLLCDPDSYMWNYPTWSWFNGQRDIIIPVDFCYEISCLMARANPDAEPVRSSEMPREQSPFIDFREHPNE